MKIYVSVLLLLTIILSACTTAETSTTAQDPFIGGTTGIQIMFVENAPPKEVTDPGPNNEKYGFEVALQVENVGEHPVPPDDLKITLSGILMSDFGLCKKDNDPNCIQDSADIVRNPEETLRAVKKDPNGPRIPGGLDHLTWEFEGYQNKLSGSLEVPLRADICYQYKTYVSARYCMLSDTQTTQETVCEIDEARKVYNSGAPVHVTVVDQSVAGKSSTILAFTIKHVGNGDISKVASEDEAAKCDDSYVAQDQVLVKVDPGNEVSSPLTLKCTGFLQKIDDKSGWIRLDDRGEGTLTCTISNMQENALRELGVEIVYDYHESKTQSLVVKHLLE